MIIIQNTIICDKNCNTTIHVCCNGTGGVTFHFTFFIIMVVPLSHKMIQIHIEAESLYLKQYHALCMCDITSCHISLWHCPLFYKIHDIAEITSLWPSLYLDIDNPLYHKYNFEYQDDRNIPLCVTVPSDRYITNEVTVG